MGLTLCYEPFKSVPEVRNRGSQRFRVAEILFLTLKKQNFIAVERAL